MTHFGWRRVAVWLGAIGVGSGCNSGRNAGSANLSEVTIELTRDGAGSGEVLLPGVTPPLEPCLAGELLEGCLRTFIDAGLGGTMFLEARPAAGSTLAGWSGCTSVTAAGQCELTFPNEGADFTLRVTFDGQPAPPASEEFRIDCTSTGQLCDQRYVRRVFTTDGVQVEYVIGGGACSNIFVDVILRGVNAGGEVRRVRDIGPLGPASLGGTRTTGVVELGPARGDYDVELQARGVEGGCNQGVLQAWGGRVTISTNPTGS